VPADLTEEKYLEAGIRFSWMMLSIAAKTLARYPNSDMGLMLYAKHAFEEAAAMLGQEAVAASTDWSVPEHPESKVEWLRHLAGKIEQLDHATREKGLSDSPRLALCLSRYLNLVEGIQNGAGSKERCL
jgi:hypothetical protein